ATGFHGYKVFPDLNNLLDSGEFDTMLYHQDQPFSTASNYSEFHVFKTAAENRLTVLLSGQGADEYLCGYDEFFTLHIKQLLKARKFREVWTNLKIKGTNRPAAIWDLIILQYKSNFWYPFITRFKKLLGRTSYPSLNNSWKKLADQYLVNFKADNLRDLSLQQMMFSSLPLQLHSEDRNSMMFAIESRLPYLDHRLVEYVASLPSAFKIHKGISKYILKESIKEVPDLIKQRTDKMAFVAPDEPWIRENHDRFRKELKDAIDNTDIFSPALLKRFDQFIAGKLNYEPIYFRAVAINRFMKIFKMDTSKAAAINDRPSIQKTLVQGDLIPTIVSCSNFLSDVNYC
ncbi:MAG: asparagine synthase-related protein, partial [Chitinophagaceae bacterium]